MTEKILNAMIKYAEIKSKEFGYTIKQNTNKRFLSEQLDYEFKDEFESRPIIQVKKRILNPEIAIYLKDKIGFVRLEYRYNNGEFFEHQVFNDGYKHLNSFKREFENILKNYL